MLPKKGMGGVKRSHPDAEEVAAGRQVNVHVDIHLSPPEEDMPAEAMQPPAEAMPPQRAVIGHATSHGNL